MAWGLIFLSGILSGSVFARSVEDVVKRYGPNADKRLKSYFTEAKLTYPPKRLALVILKKERKVELWSLQDSKPKHAHTYEILAASGMPGPKLREGDGQVPEGIYRIVSLNPNSQYHLSMKLDYPNDLDRKRAAEDKRTRLGGDIFIHGEDVSIGCVAIGNPAIEELFTLVATVGRQNVEVIIAPHDFRKQKADVFPLRYHPSWLKELYSNIQRELSRFTP